MLIKEVDVLDIDFNAFQEIENYALLTAGTIDNFNMMTATGFLCGKFFLKPMIQVYIRPNRYTYKFFEESNHFTVSFYEKKYHSALVICGETHGYECNKSEEANLHPFKYDDVVLFEEAKITFICEKVFHADISEENFDSKRLHKEYYMNQSLISECNMVPENSNLYHRIYLGQIKKVLVNK